MAFIARARLEKAWSVGAKMVPLKNLLSLFSYPAVFTACRNFCTENRGEMNKLTGKQWAWMSPAKVVSFVFCFEGSVSIFRGFITYRQVC